MFTVLIMNVDFLSTGTNKFIYGLSFMCLIEQSSMAKELA